MNLAYADITGINDSTGVYAIDGGQARRLLDARGLPYKWPLHVVRQWEQPHAEFGLADNAVDLEQLNLLPPIPNPRKILCVGRNYREHADEMGSEIGSDPVIFSKFSECLIGHGDAIQLPAISNQVDYEAELVVVIGKHCRNINPADALQCVFGYTCGNDVTARDWQKGKPGGQWLLGKSCQTFAPLGPWLVTRDAIENVNDLSIQLRLNGQQMQSSNTSKWIFKIDDLIAHLSKFMALRPGDLIFTGTPGGVGAARTPPVFLKAGDCVEVEIDKIGTLSNPVI